jgi:LysR family transcriptional regulator, hydrogen peroxide-inducible genes activator
MLRDANEIRAIASFQNNKLSGYLRLAVPSTIGPYLFKYAAPRLHRAYPQLRLHVREDLPGNLFKTLADSQDDLIITLSPSQSSDIVAIPLFREPLNLVVGADDPLAKSGKVSLADLKGRDLLTLGPAHKLHDGVLPLCEEAGAKLRFDFEGTSLDMLREMVIMGLGVTFMPGLYTNRELISDEDVAVLDLEDRQIYRTIYMAWRKATLRAGSYEKLVDFFKKLPSEVQEMKCLEPA